MEGQRKKKKGEETQMGSGDERKAGWGKRQKKEGRIEGKRGKEGEGVLLMSQNDMPLPKPLNYTITNTRLVYLFWVRFCATALPFALCVCVCECHCECV